MPEEFFNRLSDYFENVAAAMRDGAKAAKVFPNPTDKGGAREKVYSEFLKRHVPSKCNVVFGGYVFGMDGTESKQLDILVTTDICPRYLFDSSDEGGKTFSPVEGTIGVVSVKSKLDKKELIDSLNGMAAIPKFDHSIVKLNPSITVPNHEDTPYKIVYASDGISLESLSQHIESFYSENPSIPHNRRPNIIHVAGKYAIIRAITGMNLTDMKSIAGTKPEMGDFIPLVQNPDIQAIVWVLDELQKKGRYIKSYDCRLQ